jgi:ribonuclease BN (tRNA processing enzyme)
MAFEVTVLGCGEAFDERYTNTSLLLRAEERTILLDCGYSAPAPLWNAVADPDALDLIYISHAHADHCFGLPAVLGRMWEDGRTKPLAILSQPPLLAQIRASMEAGYPGLAARFQYPVEYLEALPGQRVVWEGPAGKGILFGFAPTRHSVTNLAIRVEAGGGKFCYSGDGQFTDESRALFAGADLLVHEAYSFDPSPVHGDFPGVIGMAADQNVGRLALVHIQRKVRREQGERIHALDAVVPEPGDRMALC